MIRTNSREQGFALAATIFALVLVGALVTGGFFAASQEQRIGTSDQFGSEAFYYAERGLQDGLGTHTRGSLQQALAVGAAMNEAPVTITSGGQPVGQYTLTITRLDDLLYFIESTGEVLEGGQYKGGTRTLGVVARVVNMAMPLDRAVQIFGQMSVGGTSEVDGVDDFPTEWSGCTAADTVAGIVAKDSSLVRSFGRGAIYGDPPTDEDASLDSANFMNYGDLTFDDLTASAPSDKTYAHGTTLTNVAPMLNGNGECDESHPDNWGAPTDAAHKCHFYFPILYGEGDLTVASSTNGQGILLVAGNLELSGGFEFFGIVVVKGDIKTTGVGGHINGVTLVFNDGSLNAETVARGNSELNYSSCAIQRAIENNPWTSRLIPLGQRSWIDITAAGG